MSIYVPITVSFCLQQSMVVTGIIPATYLITFMLRYDYSRLISLWELWRMFKLSYLFVTTIFLHVLLTFGTVYLITLWRLTPSTCSKHAWTGFGRTNCRP